MVGEAETGASSGSDEMNGPRRVRESAPVSVSGLGGQNETQAPDQRWNSEQRRVKPSMWKAA